MSKTDFQNGGCGVHLGFLIDMILAQFDPDVLLSVQCKFRLKLTKRLGRDVENCFLDGGCAGHLGFGSAQF